MRIKFIKERLKKLKAERELRLLMRKVNLYYGHAEFSFKNGDLELQNVKHEKLNQILQALETKIYPYKLSSIFILGVNYYTKINYILDDGTSKTLRLSYKALDKILRHILTIPEVESFYKNTTNNTIEDVDL